MPSATSTLCAAPRLTTSVRYATLKLTNVIRKEVCIISDAFSRLEPARQQRILRAALKEFAQHGYAQGSTNNIVREAGIAKGTLFYYFKSKQELYNYLVEYVLNYVEKEYVVHLDHDEPDLIARYSRAAQVKMECYIKDREILEFLGALYLKEDKVAIEEIWQGRLDEIYRALTGRMLDHVDTSLFRDDLSPEYVLKITTWVMEGYQNELIAQVRDKDLSALDMKPYWKEFYAFLEVLRRVLYRQEEVEHGNS